MNAKAAFCFIIACFWLPLPALSQGALAAETREPKVYSLEASIAEALEKNWNLKALEETLNQAMDVKRQARADFLPRFRTSYGYTRLDDVSNYESSLGGNIAVSSKDNYQWRSTATQPVFAGFALVSAYRLAALGIDQSRMNIALNRLDLAMRVKEAYFNVLIMDKALEVGLKEVEALGSNVEVTRSYYNARVVPINDLLRAEMELANAEQKLVESRNQAALARSLLNTILSRPVNAPLEVEDILAYTPEPLDLDDAIAAALENRPEVKLIDIDIQRSEQQINLARSGYYPEVNLAYDYIKEGDEPAVSGSPYHDDERWQLTLAGTWTFWEWGRTRYAVSQRQSQKAELVKTRNAVADQVRLDVREAMLNIATAEQNIPTTEKAVRQGEENLRVNQEGFRAQFNTVTDVLDAQSLLTRARVNYYRALYTYHLANAELLRATGRY